MTNQQFYLFETFIKNVYKFGQTNQSLKQRFYKYSGIAKPKKMIGILECQGGVITEAKFRMFLDKYQIKTVADFGREYFEFEGGIKILFEHFCKLVNENYDFTELSASSSFKRRVFLYKTQPMTDQDLTDNIIKWFLKNYHDTNKNEKKYTLMRDVYRNFKYSDIYRSLSSKQKSSLIKRNFETRILSNLQIRKYHKFTFSTKINGQKKTVRNVFANIEMKQ